MHELHTLHVKSTLSKLSVQNNIKRLSIHSFAFAIKLKLSYLRNLKIICY